MENITATQLPLEDILTPENVSFWPPAPGWWIVMLIICAAIIALYIFISRFRKNSQYRKEALGLLKREYDELKNLNPNLIADDIEIKKNVVESMLKILKRTAMTAYPYEKSASLYGQAWLDFLKSKSQKSMISTELARHLTEGQYSGSQDYDLDSIYQFCCLWVKDHQVEK
jgi:hypothetical protein